MSPESPDGLSPPSSSSARSHKQRKTRFNGKHWARTKGAPSNVQRGQQRVAEQIAQAAAQHAAQTAANEVAAAAKHAKRNKAITDAATRRKDNKKRNDAMRVRCKPAWRGHNACRFRLLVLSPCLASPGLFVC